MSKSKDAHVVVGCRVVAINVCATDKTKTTIDVAIRTRGSESVAEVVTLAVGEEFIVRHTLYDVALDERMRRARLHEGRKYGVH